MPLSMSLDPDKVMKKAQEDCSEGITAMIDSSNVSQFHTFAHAGRYAIDPIPKYTLPEKGIPAEAAYQLVTDEVQLDGKPSLNLASFVHTWMPPQGRQLLADHMDLNLCDQDEYPATMAVHSRCVSILGNLWKQPKGPNKSGAQESALGTATTGSSEAIMLGLLAAKRRWQHRRKSEGKSIHEPGPNLVFGANVQVAIEKFARYWEVEERAVPVDESTKYVLSPERAMEHVDENTIAVVVILGSTYTGHFEDVEGVCKKLDEYQAKTGIDVPVHVDGASGAMVAPFSAPKLKWSFELERVKSINTSGHKFGMVLPGLGWILFRDSAMIPKELVFELHYLGSVEYSFGLNFSRPAAPVLAQMFNFVNLGFEGYRATMDANLMNARLLSRALEISKVYTVLSEIHHPIDQITAAALKANALPNKDNASHYRPGLPVVAFRWTDEFKKEHPMLQQRWVQIMLRTKGWIVPNYELPPDVQKTEILRVVVKDNMTESMVSALVHDIMEITNELVETSGAMFTAGAKDGHAVKGSSTDWARDAAHKARRSDADRSRPKGFDNRSTAYSKQC